MIATTIGKITRTLFTKRVGITRDKACAALTPAGRNFSLIKKLVEVQEGKKKQEQFTGPEKKKLRSRIRK